MCTLFSISNQGWYDKNESNRSGPRGFLTQFQVGTFFQRTNIYTHVYTKFLKIHIYIYTKILKMYTQMYKQTLEMDTQTSIQTMFLKLETHTDTKIAKK